MSTTILGRLKPIVAKLRFIPLTRPYSASQISLFANNGGFVQTSASRPHKKVGKPTVKTEKSPGSISVSIAEEIVPDIEVPKEEPEEESEEVSESDSDRMEIDLKEGERILVDGMLHDNSLKFTHGVAYFNGVKLESNVIEGNKILNGEGVLMTSWGDRYEGNWKSGCMSGFGTHLTADGQMYTGEFVSNSQHGQGMYNYKDGVKYEGQ
jgi:hypothetical protein